MRKIESTQAGGNLTDEVLAWRKYFLLPTIRFDNAGRERRIKDYLRGRIELLVRNDYLESLKLKPINQKLEFNDEEIQQRCQERVSKLKFAKVNRRSDPNSSGWLCLQLAKRHISRIGRKYTNR